MPSDTLFCAYTFVARCLLPMLLPGEVNDGGEGKTFCEQASLCVVGQEKACGEHLALDAGGGDDRHGTMPLGIVARQGIHDVTTLRRVIAVTCWSPTLIGQPPSMPPA